MLKLKNRFDVMLLFIADRRLLTPLPASGFEGIETIERVSCSIRTC